MKRTLPVLLAALLGMAMGLVPSSAHAASGSSDTKVYTQPGDHLVNGRYWKTTCEKYSSSVVRCTTSIWGEKKGGGKGWVFNTLTYLASPRADWASNPLGHDGSWIAVDGRDWRTECDTAVTGQGGCRSYNKATRVLASPKPGGGYTYRQSTDWVFNNIVMFKPN